MQYTAIIKDGGLFIPNVFSDVNDGHSHIVQVEVDIKEVRKQLSPNEEPKKEEPKKLVKKQMPKQSLKQPQDLDLGTPHKSAVNELEALNDSELSEIFKAYVNNGEVPIQISLENL